jgi:hypothetical protein
MSGPRRPSLMASLAVANFQESLFQNWGLKPRAASEARHLPRRVRAHNAKGCPGALETLGRPFGGQTNADHWMMHYKAVLTDRGKAVVDAWKRGDERAWLEAQKTGDGRVGPWVRISAGSPWVPILVGASGWVPISMVLAPTPGPLDSSGCRDAREHAMVGKRPRASCLCICIGGAYDV